MPYKVAFLAVTLLVSPITTRSTPASPSDAPDYVFSISVQRDEEGVGLELTWTIAAGYYLYRDDISATLDGRNVKFATPRGEPEGFGPDHSSSLREVYRGLAMADTIGEQLPEKGVLVVTYKGCGKDAICYPPIRKAIDLATLSLSPSAASEHVDVSDTLAGHQHTSNE